MDRSNAARRGRHGTTQSANERLKSRWNQVRIWSATATVVLHAAVLAAWPLQTVSEVTRSAAPAPVHLIPLAHYTASPDVAERSSVAVAEPEELQTPQEQQPDPFEALKVPRPSLASADPLTMAPPQPDALPVAELRLASAGTVLRDHGQPTASFTWPEISNPRAMVRFLRARYNDIHTHIVPERFVSLALWINERGAVEWCEVQESSGDPSLDEIAMTVISDVVEFIPASRHGAPVSVAVVLSIPFQVPW